MRLWFLRRLTASSWVISKKDRLLTSRIWSPICKSAEVKQLAIEIFKHSPSIQTVLRRCPCPRRWQRCPNHTQFHLESLILATGRARWAGQSVSLGPFCDDGCTLGAVTPTVRGGRSKCSRPFAVGRSELTLNRRRRASRSPAECTALPRAGSGEAVTRRSCCTSAASSSLAIALSSSRTSPPSGFACTSSPPLRGSSTWTAGRWSRGWRRSPAARSGAPPNPSPPSRWTHRGRWSCCPWCRSRSRCCWDQRSAAAAVVSPCSMTCCDGCCWSDESAMSVWVASWGCLPLYYHFVSNVWFSLITDGCSECCDSCGGLSCLRLSPLRRLRSRGTAESKRHAVRWKFWASWRSYLVSHGRWTRRRRGTLPTAMVFVDNCRSAAGPLATRVVVVPEKAG